MKKITMLLLLILFLPTFAFAGQIYGSLKIDNKSVGEGVEIKIKCGEAPYSGRTDPYGSYSVYLRQAGRCTLTVTYGGQESQPFGIESYEDPVRYDFDLVRQDGTLVLRRR